MSSKAQTREKDYERGLRIADRRKAMGLSQDELAHRVGIGRQALSAIENGGDFKTRTLDNLAIVLGVSVDFIMYGKNEENSELLSEAMDVLSDMDELQIRQCLILSITEEKDDAIDGMEEYQAYSEIIKENIEYDALLQRNPYEKDAIQGIFDLILETVISNKASMTISGQEYPMNLVKSKFLKLNSSHIEYVLGCLGKNTTKVYNIKSYLLLACLMR